MTEPTQTQAQPTQNETEKIMESNPTPERLDTTLLEKIEKHLGSIRSMLQFFVVITLIGILLTGCNILMSL